jgi:hypothetical protein
MQTPTHLINQPVQFLEYFFTDADAAAFRDMGFNMIGLGVNYHHFEDDMNPRVFQYEGLKHLDRVIDIVSSHPALLPNGEVAELDSALGMASTPLWIFTPCQVVKAQTGIATIPRTRLGSGCTRIFMIERCSFGNTSRSITRITPGWQVTTCLMSHWRRPA